MKMPSVIPLTADTVRKAIAVTLKKQPSRSLEPLAMPESSRARSIRPPQVSDTVVSPVTPRLPEPVPVAERTSGPEPVADQDDELLATQPCSDIGEDGTSATSGRAEMDDSYKRAPQA